MRKLLLVFLIFLGMNALLAPAFAMNSAFARERIGVISDALLIRETPYNAYERTPDFLLQDISDILKKNFEVVPVSETRTALVKNRITHTDMAYLRNIEKGYDLNFIFLKKLAKLINVDKLVIVTSSIDMQRDFLKPTLWNTLNIAGLDVVNPTHRVSVYTALVDCKKESVLWENIYAKNIRNNKMKNLDTSVANNFEGMMRLKQYSKYISPEIAYNVTLKLAPGSVTPVQYVNRAEGVVMVVNKKMRIGSDKHLSNTNHLSNKFSDWQEKRAVKKEQKMLKKQQEEAEKAFLKDRL